MQFGLNSPSLNSENVASAEPAYSSYECLQRLQTLQWICTALALDALLFVGGVDGRHHEASREVLAWPLGGESGRVVFGRGGTDVELDEVVLVVTPTAARLYCPAAVYSTRLLAASTRRGSGCGRGCSCSGRRPRLRMRRRSRSTRSAPSSRW